MNIWFTADTHFGHGNICKYANRLQFMNKAEKYIMQNCGIDKQNGLEISKKTSDKMNKILIRNINQRVKKEDRLYILGDHCFAKKGEKKIKWEYYRKQLNCEHIISITGNHDKKSNGIKEHNKIIFIKYGGRFVQLVHNQKNRIRNVSDLVLCGHCHQYWRFKKFNDINCCNVGVDVWNYYPVSINEILTKYNRWKKCLG